MKLADVACGKDMTERQDAEDSARMVMGEGLEGGGVAQQMVSEWISKQRERERDDGSNAEPLRFDVLVEVLSALRVVCPDLGGPTTHSKLSKVLFIIGITISIVLIL